MTRPATGKVRKAAKKAIPVAERVVPASSPLAQPLGAKRRGRPARVAAQQPSAAETLASAKPAVKRGRPPKSAAPRAAPIETPVQTSGAMLAGDLSSVAQTSPTTPAPTKARAARKSAAPASGRGPGRPKKSAAPTSSTANPLEMLQSSNSDDLTPSDATAPHTAEQPVSSATPTDTSSNKSKVARTSAPRARKKLSISVPASAALEPEPSHEGIDPVAALTTTEAE